MELYRYRSASINTYHELLLGEMWYSRYTELNDPCEGLYINQSNHGDLGALISELRVCCFSQNDKNLLMWAHYADAHRGICLEYEVDEATYNTQFFPIFYSDSLPILEKIRTFPPEHPAAGKLLMHVDQEGAIFRTKSIDWAYEEECRTFRKGVNSASKGQYGKSPGILKSVKFGLRVPETVIKAIHRILLAQDSIIFQRAELLNGKYEISFKSVSRENL